MYGDVSIVTLVMLVERGFEFRGGDIAGGNEENSQAP